MTGYGRGTASGNGLELVVELTSVNRRSLDIAFSLPREWQGLERPLGERIRKRIQRGRVQATVQIERGGQEEAIQWDEERVALTLSRLADLAEAQGISFEPDAQVLYQIAAAHRAAADLPSPDEILSLATGAVNEALDQLANMRLKEGKALETDLRERCKLLLKRIEEVRAESGEVVPNYREELMRRLKLAGLDLDLDDERVLKEIAIFADRCDISEEITRVESHLEQFRMSLGEERPIGRKLEFIQQELNREFNTIGAKANCLAITRAVIEAKNDIERIREQLQNVE